MKIKGKKQVETLKVLKPDTQQLSIKDFVFESKQNPEIVNELKRIGETEQNVDRNKLFCKRF